MTKEYRYRKHIYWGQYVILVVFVLLFLLILGLSASIMLTTGFRPSAISLAGLAFVILLEGAMLWYFYYRLAGVVVSVNDDALIYKTRVSEKRIPLENLYLEFASFKYVGGWLKIKAGKETIRITVVLKDISELLQEIKTKLDNKQLSNHYDSHKMFGFLKTAAAADQSWERINIVGKVFLLILTLGITIVAGFIFGNFPFYGLMLVLFWGFFSMVWITTVYIIAEITLFRVIAKKSNEINFTVPPRDLSNEKIVFDKAFIWGSLAYFLFSLFVLVVVVWIRPLL